MKRISLLFVLVSVLIISSCSDCDKKLNLKDETIAIENVLEKYIIANENQDFELTEEIWAPNPDIILYGTDSDDRLMGWTNIRAAIKDQFSQITDTYISASDQFIKLNCTGNTAWFAETLNYNFVYKGEARSYEGLRFTGVLEKMDGEWKIVQAHLSVPASVGVGK
ncbi:MAG: nuclear transport factor 2 family protein [Bacteroidales bacterium]|jgi:ketosteroid isomerase-like protein|nr:nuclear transport factor 2 family protein [Bacteroidales bacterium]